MDMFPFPPFPVYPYLILQSPKSPKKAYIIPKPSMWHFFGINCKKKNRLLSTKEQFFPAKNNFKKSKVVFGDIFEKVISHFCHSSALHSQYKLMFASFDLILLCFGCGDIDAHKYINSFLNLIVQISILTYLIIYCYLMCSIFYLPLA